MVRKEFQSGEPIALKNLYKKMKQNPEFNIPEDKLKHRVRSIVDTLRHKNEIFWVKPSTWKTVDHK